MIPRRKLSIQKHDFTEWLKTLLRPRAAREDVTQFEAAFSDYLGGAFARATASGRDALLLAMKAIGLQAGDEVIIPAYTLGELLPLMQTQGYRLVAADIEADTFNIDVQSIAQHITPRTKAICATHLMGAPCDIEAICALAAQHQIAVIEDCAHALGASVGGQKVGTFGAAAIFSLEASKAVPTYGGGIVVAQDAQAAAEVSHILDRRTESEFPALRKALFTWIEELIIRSPLYSPLAKILFSEQMSRRFEKFYRGSHDHVRTDVVAYSHYQARLGLQRLAELDTRNTRLNQRWQRLAHSLPEHFAFQQRERIGNPAFYNFVALSDLPTAELRRRAAQIGVDLGIGSEIMDDCGTLLNAEDCPIATSVFERAVLIPLYDGLSEKDSERLLSTLQHIAQGG